MSTMTKTTSGLPPKPPTKLQWCVPDSPASLGASKQPGAISYTHMRVRSSSNKPYLSVPKPRTSNTPLSQVDRLQPLPCPFYCQCSPRRQCRPFIACGFRRAAATALWKPLLLVLFLLAYQAVHECDVVVVCTTRVVYPFNLLRPLRTRGIRPVSWSMTSSGTKLCRRSISVT